MSIHPGYAAADNANVVFLGSFVHVVPDQSASDDDSARSFVVCHLGKLSGVDMDSARRRQPGICGMITAFHLEDCRVRCRYLD